jgi:hypothetical protein
MPRERFCDHCGDWHKLDEPWPYECQTGATSKHSDFPAPMTILDTMDPVQSQTNGKMYDSKAALRAEYKRAGVVEVGNDPSVMEPSKNPVELAKAAGKKNTEQDIEKALQQAGISA